MCDDSYHLNMVAPLKVSRHEVQVVFQFYLMQGITLQVIKLYANDMMIQQSVAKWQTLQQAHQTSHTWKTQLYKTEQLQHYASLTHGT
jgi:hypothetical protein